MVCRKDLGYGAVLQRKKAVRGHRPLTPRRPVSLRLWGETVRGRHRKALAMLSDHAYHHRDAQQRQPAGFHTAPLVKVIFGIKILKTHSHSHSQIIVHPTKEEGYTGSELNSACVWANYSQQTWSQTRAQNAKSLHRSIYSMEDSALPKKALLAGNGRTNLLATEYTPKVVKGDPDDSEDSWRDKIKNTLSGIDTAKERNQWKRDENAPGLQLH